jgi:hypothetical protein
MTASTPRTKDAAVCLGRDTIHPMFRELFIQADADDPEAGQDWRRRMHRSRRVRPAMVVRSRRRADLR